MRDERFGDGLRMDFNICHGFLSVCSFTEKKTVRLVKGSFF